MPFPKLSAHLKFKKTLFIEDDVPLVVDKARKLLEAIEKDLNNPKITLPPESRKAAEELAKDLYSHLNNWISNGQKDLGPNGPQDFAIKCAKSINCQRTAIEAASGFSSTAGFSNFFKIVANACISAINSCIKDKNNHIEPYALGNTTEMHNKSTSEYRKAIDNYRNEAHRLKDENVQVDDLGLDYHNNPQ